MLSAGPEAPMNLEYLMEDIDLVHLLKREEYEGLVQPVINRIEKYLT